jgi:hypothetical protein
VYKITVAGLRFFRQFILLQLIVVLLQSAVRLAMQRIAEEQIQERLPFLATLEQFKAGNSLMTSASYGLRLLILLQH